MSYDYNDYMNWGNDKDLLTACHHAVEIQENAEIDPVTGQKISIATAERALLVIEAFEMIVTEKQLRN